MNTRSKNKTKKHISSNSTKKKKHEEEVDKEEKVNLNQVDNLTKQLNALILAKSSTKWTTVRSKRPVATEHMIYFEVILNTDGEMIIGWATEKTNLTQVTLGEDVFSVGFDGYNCCVYHESQRYLIPQITKWKKGDVIGCLIDQNTLRFIFSLNGTLIPTPPNVYFSTLPYYGSVSLSPYQKVYFNFGQLPFKYLPEIAHFNYNMPFDTPENRRISKEQQSIRPEAKTFANKSISPKRITSSQDPNRKILVDFSAKSIANSIINVGRSSIINSDISYEISDMRPKFSNYSEYTERINNNNQSNLEATALSDNNDVESFVIESSNIFSSRIRSTVSIPNSNIEDVKTLVKNLQPNIINTYLNCVQMKDSNSKIRDISISSGVSQSVTVGNNLPMITDHQSILSSLPSTISRRCQICSEATTAKLVNFACCPTLSVCLNCVKVFTQCPLCLKVSSGEPSSRVPNGLKKINHK